MVHGSVRWLEYIYYASGVCMHSHWVVIGVKGIGVMVECSRVM